MTFSAYVICATPRSGSTLLCDLLTASGIAGEPHSYFRSEDIAYWAGLWNVGEPTTARDPVFNRAYLHAMIRAGMATTGVFGLRLMRQSVEEAGERLRAALGGDVNFADRLRQAFGPTLFIHLSRRDTLAQAASLVRARQTGLWHMAVDGSERERTAPPRPPIFDAAGISRARDGLVADIAGWSAFFEQHGINPLRLTFEQLAVDPSAALAEVLTALGRDAGVADGLSPLTARMADATTMSWLERMRTE